MSDHERHYRALTVSEHLYKVLVTAYPKAFRRGYGSQMTQAFRDLCREELGRSGKAGLAGLRVRTVLDLMTTALAERAARKTVR